MVVVAAGGAGVGVRGWGGVVAVVGVDVEYATDSPGTPSHLSRLRCCRHRRPAVAPAPCEAPPAAGRAVPLGGRRARPAGRRSSVRSPTALPPRPQSDRDAHLDPSVHRARREGCAPTLYRNRSEHAHFPLISRTGSAANLSAGLPDPLTGPKGSDNNQVSGSERKMSVNVDAEVSSRGRIWPRCLGPFAECKRVVSNRSLRQDSGGLLVVPAPVEIGIAPGEAPGRWLAGGCGGRAPASHRQRRR